MYFYIEHLPIFSRIKSLEKGAVLAHTVGSTRIKPPIIAPLDNIDLIKDHGNKLVICLSLLLIQPMLALLNGIISLLVVWFVAFPTNHICLLVTLVAVIPIRPLLFPFYL